MRQRVASHRRQWLFSLNPFSFTKLSADETRDDKKDNGFEFDDTRSQNDTHGAFAKKSRSHTQTASLQVRI